jgi:hypothetical protein
MTVHVVHWSRADWALGSLVGISVCTFIGFCLGGGVGAFLGFLFGSWAVSR